VAKLQDRDNRMCKDIAIKYETAGEMLKDSEDQTVVFESSESEVTLKLTDVASTLSEALSIDQNSRLCLCIIGKLLDRLEEGEIPHFAFTLSQTIRDMAVEALESRMKDL